MGCAFAPAPFHRPLQTTTALNLQFPNWGGEDQKDVGRTLAGVAAAGLLAASLSFAAPAFAENELNDKYGGGLDTSLVDQTCLVDQCSLQAKACLADDPNCRKGLTCTAKCLGATDCVSKCLKCLRHGVWAD